MELFFPSFALLGLALILIIVVFPRLTPFLLIILAIILFVFAAYNHMALFGKEYRGATWLQASRAFAPIILIGFVVILSIGYLLYLAGLRKSGPSANSMLRMPNTNVSPETATNVITEAIGNAINNVSSPRARPSFLSKSPSLNITNSEARNVAASRLAQQI